MKKKGAKESAVEATSRMLKAVADLDRLKIVYFLRGGSKNVGQIADMLNAEIVNVSHHLSVLRESKVVKDEKKGRYVYYSINPDVCKVSGGLETFHLGFCRLELQR